MLVILVLIIAVFRKARMERLVLLGVRELLVPLHVLLKRKELFEQFVKQLLLLLNLQRNALVKVVFAALLQITSGERLCFIRFDHDSHALCDPKFESSDVSLLD
jgi:hypothetical protein